MAIIESPVMSTYSVAEAKNTLPRLLDKALAGEQVVITRHGKPIAEIRSVVDKRPLNLEKRRAAYAEIIARRDARPPLIDVTAVELVHAAWDDPAA